MKHESDDGMFCIHCAQDNREKEERKMRKMMIKPNARMTRRKKDRKKNQPAKKNGRVTGCLTCVNVVCV